MQQEKAIIAKSIYDAGWSEKVYLDTKRTGNISCIPSHEISMDEGHQEEFDNY
jgi:hypothetical protein